MRFMSYDRIRFAFSDRRVRTVNNSRNFNMERAMNNGHEWAARFYIFLCVVTGCLGTLLMLKMIYDLIQ